VLLVVAVSFAAAPSASADKIVFTSVDRSGGGLVVMRPGGKVVSVARGFVNDWYDVSLDGRRLVRGGGPGLLVNPFTPATAWPRVAHASCRGGTPGSGCAGRRTADSSPVPALWMVSRQS
jgi:hypothetical protein